MQWYLAVLKKYIDFKGRASRTEYWMFVLINFLISFGLSLISRLFVSMDGEGLAMIVSLLAVIYALAVLCPSLGVAVRRLHDTDKSGWMLLLALIPIIGPFVVLAFMIMDSQPGKNQYGEPVKGKTPEQVK